MQRQLRRLASLLLALLLLITAATAAVAEDWRDLLRGLYGLEDDDDGGEAAFEDGESEELPVREDFELPVTDPQDIVDYLEYFGELPENFITKNEAKALGWDSRYNYVGDVAPGKSIGGDRFGNYEGLLPDKKGRTWYECDANYTGKKRGAERVLFSSDGLYYYTNDHYKTFTEMFPGEY